MSTSEEAKEGDTEGLGGAWELVDVDADAAESEAERADAAQWAAMVRAFQENGLMEDDPQEGPLADEGDAHGAEEAREHRGHRLIVVLRAVTRAVVMLGSFNPLHLAAFLKWRFEQARDAGPRGGEPVEGEVPVPAKELLGDVSGDSAPATPAEALRLLRLTDGFDAASPRELREACGAPLDSTSVSTARWAGGGLRPRYFVLLDHAHGEVVVVIRGTTSRGDVLSDLSCSNLPYYEGMAHRGCVSAVPLNRALPAL